MKKLLLTSDGLVTPKLGKQFLGLVGKNPEEIKVLFVPTASKAKEDPAYLEKKSAYFKHCEDELMSLGIQKDHLAWLDINAIPTDDQLNTFDVMYVCGGNTFFLLHEIRRAGFDKKIIDFINKGKVYVGVSAGSIIVGPDIFIASPFDVNDVGLQDTTGLKMTGKIICPHYQRVEEKVVSEVEHTGHCNVVRLRDDQALEEIDGISKIIE